MKKLFLIRHAKSDWSIQGLSDIDRPLNARGYPDAHRIGAHLKKMNVASGIFISSPAVRALSTALIVASEIKYSAEKISIRRDLYETDERQYESVIQSIDDNFESAFIFGHNPTISNVISNLSKNYVGDIPTCTVFGLTFNTDTWKDVIALEGTVTLQLSPKTLSEQGN